MYVLCEYVDMSQESEGGGVLKAKFSCKTNAECQPKCPVGLVGICMTGRCWCYFFPPHADNIPNL